MFRGRVVFGKSSLVALSALLYQLSQLPMPIEAPPTDRCPSLVERVTDHIKLGMSAVFVL